MSKQNSITIDIPKGFEFDSFDESSLKINIRAVSENFFEKLKKYSDNKSWLACLFEFHGTTDKDFNDSCAGLSSDEIGYRLEKLIVAAYNGKEVLDWADGTNKYYPIFKMPSSGSRFSFYVIDSRGSGSIVGSRQVFHGPKAYDHMIDAVKKFLPQYEQSRTT